MHTSNGIQKDHIITEAEVKLTHNKVIANDYSRTTSHEAPVFVTILMPVIFRSTACVTPSYSVKFNSVLLTRFAR